PQGRGEIVVGLGVIGPQTQNLLVNLDGLVRLLLRDESVAEVVQRFDKFGPQPQCLSVAGDRLFRLSGRSLDDPQKTPNVGVARLALQDLAVQLRRAHEVAHLVTTPGMRQQLVKWGHGDFILRPASRSQRTRGIVYDCLYVALTEREGYD